MIFYDHNAANIFILDLILWAWFKNLITY